MRSMVAAEMLSVPFSYRRTCAGRQPMAAANSPWLMPATCRAKRRRSASARCSDPAVRPAMSGTSSASARQRVAQER